MKQHKIVRSGDATTLIIEGDIRRPEPGSAVIRFPGGFAEVTRCTDGTYWAHVQADGAVPTESRVRYDYGSYLQHGVSEIPDLEHVVGFGCRFPKPTEVP